MATIAQLNVEIAAKIKGLQDGLRDAERQMRRSAGVLSRAGNEISTSLSIPLAAAGVAAVSAAGDIESLTLALKSQLGSASAAEKELSLLTEAAKNPGLGVEQAVRGSVRLQGVGLAADEARQVLIQMGNAIAATGGSAQELDSVTRQFSQMISKGRVLQEDVSVLSENMPGLAGLMQKAFGTQNVEAIRAMGVSGKEFVLRITEAAKELPRVESGIKNSIGNALDSLKQSAAKFGFAINNAFDITGAIESFTSFLLRLSQGFSDLNPAVQKLIVGIAGFAVAIGPILKVIGGVKLLQAQFLSAAQSVLGGVKNLAAGALGAVKAFQAMNLAMKLTVVGAAIAAVTALYLAYDHYSNSLSNTGIAHRALQDVERSANENIAAQKVEVEGLVSAYKAENTTTAQKKQILSELKRISPEYFGTLRVGKGDVEALTLATARYTEELLKQAKVTAAKDRLVEIEKAILNLNETAKPTTLQTFGNFLLNAGNATKFAYEQTKSYTNNIAEQKSALEAEREALAKLVSSEAVATISKNKYAAATSNATGEVSKQSKVLKEVLSDIENAKPTALLIGEDGDLAKIEALEKGIKKLVDAGFSPASKEVQNLKKEYDGLISSFGKVAIDVIQPKPVSNTPIQPQNAPDQAATTSLQGIGDIVKETNFENYATQAADLMSQLQSGVLGFKDAFEQTSQLVSERGTLMQNVFLGMGEAIAQASLSGQASFKQLGLAAAGAAAKIIRAYIQQGVAAAVAKALSSLPFPINIAAGAAAGGLAAALFTNLIGKVGLKGFAAGTRQAPGGLALVGERGRELIQLPKDSRVYSAGQTSNILGNSLVNMFISGEFRIRGDELVLAYDKAKTKANRIR